MERKDGVLSIRVWLITASGLKEFGAEVTVRLLFDCAGTRCRGYGEAVVRLCGHTVQRLR